MQSFGILASGKFPDRLRILFVELEPFPDICLSFSLIFPIETVPALSTAKLHLINIPLIYRENLAGLRPAGVVN
jgi:hypothetical protein